MFQNLRMMAALNGRKKTFYAPKILKNFRWNVRTSIQRYAQKRLLSHTAQILILQKHLNNDYSNFQMEIIDLIYSEDVEEALLVHKHLSDIFLSSLENINESIHLEDISEVLLRHEHQSDIFAVVFREK